MPHILRKQQPKTTQPRDPFRKMDDPAALKKTPGVFEEMTGQQISIQERNGPVIEGKLVECTQGFVKLEDVVITGPHNKVQTDWILIDRNMIIHIAPVI
jgi:hypothetical protein